MSATYDLSYKADRAETLNAMQVAGKSVLRRAKASVIWVQWGFLCVLAQMDAVAFFITFRIAKTGKMRSPLIWVYPLIYIATRFAALMLSKRIYALTEDTSVNSRFGSENRITMGASGFTLYGGDSAWQMSWADVEDVRLGEKAIAIVTGGVALPIPKSAFEDFAAAEMAFADMQVWLLDGRS